MNTQDMKKIIIMLLIFIILFIGVIFILNKKITYLERKIIKITHELDYITTIVNDLNK